MKALVIRHGTLGDIIVTLPVVQTLRKNGYAVTLAARDVYGRFLADRGCVDSALPLDGATWTPMFSPDPPPDAARLLAGYDLVISYTDGDEVFSRNLKKYSRVSPVFCAPEKLAEPKHITDRLLLPLEKIFPDIERTPEIPACLRPARFVIHPGSGGARKNWPREKFRELSEHLVGQGKVSVVLGPAEERDIAFWMAAPAGVEVRVCPSIAELAALLEEARCYTGNDSGVTHLAAALGVPVVALFGPTDPAEWGPRGRTVRIMKFLPEPEKCSKI